MFLDCAPRRRGTEMHLHIAGLEPTTSAASHASHRNAALRNHPCPASSRALPCMADAPSIASAAPFRLQPSAQLSPSHGAILGGDRQPGAGFCFVALCGDAPGPVHSSPAAVTTVSAPSPPRRARTWRLLSRLPMDKRSSSPAPRPPPLRPPRHRQMSKGSESKR